MPELPPAPPPGELSKLSSAMLQYVFDLETKVEQSFHISVVAGATLVGFALGFVVFKILL
jgi:hypothetical protein